MKCEPKAQTVYIWNKEKVLWYMWKAGRGRKQGRGEKKRRKASNREEKTKKSEKL